MKVLVQTTWYLQAVPLFHPLKTFSLQNFSKPRNTFKTIFGNPSRTFLTIMNTFKTRFKPLKKTFRTAFKTSTLSPLINTLSKRPSTPSAKPLRGPPPKTCHNLFVPPQSTRSTRVRGFEGGLNEGCAGVCGGSCKGVEDLVCYRFSSMMRTQIPTPTRTLRTAHSLSTFLKVQGRIVKIIPSCHHC